MKLGTRCMPIIVAFFLGIGGSAAVAQMVTYKQRRGAYEYFYDESRRCMN